MVVAVEGTGATDGDFGRSARHTGRSADFHTGDLTLDGGGEAGAGGLAQFVGLQVLDRVTAGLLLAGDTHGGDDDFVKELGIRLELDIDDAAAVHDLGDRHVTDGREFKGAVGGDGKFVDAVTVGGYAGHRTAYDYRSEGDSFSGRRIRNRTANGYVLRENCYPEKEGQQKH